MFILLFACIGSDCNQKNLHIFEWDLLQILTAIDCIVVYLLHVICQKYTCNELNVKIYNIQTDNSLCFQLFFSLPNEVRDVLVFLVGFPSFFLSFILSVFFFFTPTMALSKENPQIFNAISLLTFMGLQTIMTRCALKSWNFQNGQRCHDYQSNAKI